jgi:hypothetical protein
MVDIPNSIRMEVFINIGLIFFSFLALINTLEVF